jgi:hypothetical protein
VGNSPLAIGPRTLTENQEQHGDLLLGTARAFLTAGPLAAPGKVRFSKRGGHAEATVSVCAFDDKGRHEELATFHVDGDADDRRTFDAAVPAGKVIALIADSESPVKKLLYSVNLLVG